jgi:hypothetical protein
VSAYQATVEKRIFTLFLLRAGDKTALTAALCDNPAGFLSHWEKRTAAAAGEETEFFNRLLGRVILIRANPCSFVAPQDSRPCFSLTSCRATHPV